MKVGGDVASALTLADQLEHLEFAITEFFDRGTGTARAATGQRVEERGGELFADINPATEHEPNGGQQLVAASGFHEVAARAGTESTLGINQFVLNGKNQDRQLAAAAHV